MSPLLLLSVLLLGGWPADGAQNASEPEVSPSVQLTGASTSLHIVAKEGDSMLIECNVTGRHGGVQWFNSKGPLTGEECVSRVMEKDGVFSFSAASQCGFFRNRFCWFLKLGQKSTRLCLANIQ